MAGLRCGQSKGWCLGERAVRALVFPCVVQGTLTFCVVKLPVGVAMVACKESECMAAEWVGVCDMGTQREIV